MTRLRPLGAAVLLTLVASSPAGARTTSAPVAAPARPAVVESRVVGHSVEGRAIRAWHLGQPERDDVPRVLLIATMHGDEGATRQILTALRDGPPVTGVDLWVVPVHNPDGLAHGTRRNAHGVDLNRNYPHAWADLDGRHESGTGPASEPETRAMVRFVDAIRPDRILSFHQPLHGVDTDTKAPRFATEVARRLHLPRTRLSCGGVCHGTMTGWFNSTHAGAMLTVEYGAHPTRRTMRVDAPRQVLAVLGARRADPPPA